MRNIKYIAVHCSAGNQRSKAADIVAFHMRPVSQGGRGWKAPGYHYIIEADGTTCATWNEELVSLLHLNGERRASVRNSSWFFRLA